MAQLTKEQHAIRDMTREFVQKEVTPFAAEWDRTATVPLDTLRRIGALGLFGVCVPTEWGGSGADFTSYVLATEELAYGDAGLCNMVSATNSFGLKVRDFGTPEQKERFLRPVASGREIACLALTEPHAGSDVANLRSRAVRHGNRYLIAAQSVGVARAAFDAALKYAREREAFGKKLMEHQAIAFQLAEMATGIEVARQMYLHAATLKEARVRSIKEASMSKLFASQMCERVCSAAIQIHGGYGYVNDYPVEKLYRDARVFQIYDGTNEVQKILISRELAAGH